MLQSFHLGRLRLRHRVDASADALKAALADFGRVARDLPGVRRSELLAAEGPVSVVELTLRDRSRRLTLELVRLEAGVRFTEVDRLAGHGIEGELRLEAAGDGADDGADDGCVVDLRCRVPGLRSLLWPPARRRLREALTAALGALGVRGAAGAGADGALVEIVEEGVTAAELRLRIGGREYRLVPE